MHIHLLAAIYIKAKTLLLQSQVWIGYNQSLRPCQSGLTLNMDITAAAFLEGQPMLQLIGTTVGMQDLSRGLSPVQVKSINKAVRGVQVRPGFSVSVCFCCCSQHSPVFSVLHLSCW